jgi:hypothetical protein
MPSAAAAAAAAAAYADTSGDTDSTAHFKDGVKDARPGTSFSAKNHAKLLAYVDRPSTRVRVQVQSPFDCVVGTSSHAADVAGVAESKLAAKVKSVLQADGIDIIVGMPLNRCRLKAIWPSTLAGTVGDAQQRRLQTSTVALLLLLMLRLLFCHRLNASAKKKKKIYPRPTSQRNLR